jgi:drug/metabolite transporter (DMT)-like permease
MMRTFLLTACALGAFAANSILARLALGAGAIDASSYSSLRIVSGAVVLWLIAAASGRREAALRPEWGSAAWLCLYAVPFSFAYISLSTGTGAVLLFAAVQVTMLLAAYAGGERLSAAQWLGLGLAGGGVVYLVSPGLDAPSLTGSVLMVLAGAAWGAYSLCGRRAADPIASTAANFVYAAPLMVPVFAGAVLLDAVTLSAAGVALALASGGIASGLGYVLWYAALRHLTAGRAAIVQLLVPVMAAAGGVLILGEAASWRLVQSATVILAGVALALRAPGGRRGRHPSRSQPSRS